MLFVLATSVYACHSVDTQKMACELCQNGPWGTDSSHGKGCGKSLAQAVVMGRFVGGRQGGER